MEEVQARLVELIDELKRAGAYAEARWFKREAAGLVRVTEARRTVNRLVTRLARFRTHPGEIPETPGLLIVACRLEDACVAVLKAGFVPAARPTLATRFKRTFRLVGGSISVGLVLLALAVVWVDYGHLMSPHASSFAGPLKLLRGGAGKFRLRVSDPPQLRDAVRGVEFSVIGGCMGDQVIDGFVCSVASPHDWGGKTLPAMELKMDQRAYGLVFSLSSPQVIAGRGEVTVHVATSPTTPAGRYLVSLTAAYRGYGPSLDCWPFLQKNGLCELQVGAERKDVAQAVPQLIIEVGQTVMQAQPPRPTVEEQHQAQERAERAATLTARVEAVEVVVLENERLLARGDYEIARPRIERLLGLWAESGASDPGSGDPGAAGADVTGSATGEVDRRLAELHARAFAQQGRVEAFNDGLYEALFAELYGASRRPVDEDQGVARLAKRFAVSRDYVRLIQLQYAERIAARMETARVGAHHRLLERCGQVPTGTWKAIDRLLSDPSASRGRKLRLQECLTPRLSAEHCWEITCEHEWYSVRPDGDMERSRHRSKFSFSNGFGRLLSTRAVVATAVHQVVRARDD